ncbi:MAG: hypothetical protein H7Z39_16930 [Burkholderiaceae bacterium]|nr:hypothetical protein [Burkholderiaceae bacterium]
MRAAGNRAMLIIEKAIEAIRWLFFVYRFQTRANLIAFILLCLSDKPPHQRE